MNKRRNLNETNTAPVYVGVESIMKDYSIGRSTALKIGELAGASVKIGGRRLYNAEKVRSYFDSLLNA